MNALSFLPSWQPPTHLHDWRLAVMLLICCHFLWTTTESAAAAASLYQTPVVTADTPFEIALREEVTLADDTLFIWFFAVLSDNRCPIGATCVEAGKAEFKFLVNHGDPASEEIFWVSLAADERIMYYQGYEIELLEVLTPAPAPGVHFITQNYHLRVIVRATDAVQRQTPIVEAPATQIDTYTPIQSNEDQFNVTFDDSFILRSGQTANFPAGDLHITLHSIAPDSGCLDPWCDEMWLHANLSITTTDLQQSGAMIGTISPGNPYVFTLGDYSILGLKVDVLGEGPQATAELTLRVYTFAEEDSPSASQKDTSASQTPPPPIASTIAGDDNLASSEANAISPENVNTPEPSSNGIRDLLPASIVDAFDWLAGLFR